MVTSLKVAFDDQIFVAQRRGGFSKYFVELIKRLPEHGIEPVLLPRTTTNLHLIESGLVEAAPERSPLAERAAWFTWRAFGRPRSQPTRLPDFDVLHHTFTHPTYRNLWSGPRVLTVVDMTPELFPHLFKLGNPHFAKQRFAEEVDALISISQNTTDDLARLYGEHLRAKTTTIHFGIGEEYLAPPKPNALDLPARFALFVGVRGGYKDFPTAVATVAKVRKDPRHADLHLVFAGGGPPAAAAEQELLAEHGLADVSHHIRPDDAQMPELYRRAEVFLFPSHYEGFGMPTLEALAAGTPTVLADASCSREIGGDVAQYAPVGDVDAMTLSVLKALSADGYAERAAAGVAHASGFTWDACAAAHADLYRKVAAGRSA